MKSRTRSSSSSAQATPALLLDHSSRSVAPIVVWLGSRDDCSSSFHLHDRPFPMLSRSVLFFVHRFNELLPHACLLTPWVCLRVSRGKTRRTRCALHVFFVESRTIIAWRWRIWKNCWGISPAIFEATQTSRLWSHGSWGMINSVCTLTMSPFADDDI